MSLGSSVRNKINRKATPNSTSLKRSSPVSMLSSFNMPCSAELQRMAVAKQHACLASECYDLAEP